jgi:uncharacterized membrane protein (UPF0127 family)
MLLLIAWPKPISYTLHTNGQAYHLQTADTPRQRSKGLSGKPTLPADSGMLFIYPNSGVNRCYWMKDMQFPVDIIWTDSLKKVVHLEHDVQPDDYPTSYCSSVSSQYVIELNAGETARQGIVAGQNLSF